MHGANHTHVSKTKCNTNQGVYVTYSPQHKE